jgi:hypothetical protein
MEGQNHMEAIRRACRARFSGGGNAADSISSDLLIGLVAGGWI